MPDGSWDRAALRFRAPPAVTLYLPVAVAFLIQVPGTLAVVAGQRVQPRFGIASVLLAAASALALLAARRWPGPTVAVVTALTLADLVVPPDGGPPWVALAFAIVGAIVRDARLWAVISVGAGWLAAITLGGVFGVTWHPFRIALSTLGLAVCFVIGEALRARFTHAAQVRQQLVERRRTVEQEERTRIARELHDVIAHSLSQIAVQSGVGLHLFDREPERARDALTSIRALSATGLDEVRGVLAFLRGDEDATTTAPLTPQPQLAELPALVSQRSGLGLAVSLDDRLGGAAPPSALQTTAYRIAQEALTNVVRHSAAATAAVTVDRAGADFVLTVADDGVGIHTRTGEAEGGGVRGMRERASLVGGTLELSAGAHGGTVVTARLPWEGPA